MKTLIIILLSLCLSSYCYADYSTNCYELGNEINCDTKERRSAYSGISQGLQRIADRKHQQAQIAQLHAIQQAKEEQRIAQEQLAEQMRQESVEADKQFTRDFLNRHPDVVYRSKEFHQIADLYDVGYDIEDAYAKVMKKDRQSLDEIWEKTHPKTSET